MTTAMAHYYRATTQVLDLLPRLVRDARLKAGKSQREVAEEAGSSAAAICRLEAGGPASQFTIMAMVKWLHDQEDKA
jgi:transcriptional regulator with XRE-family HTH domain